MQDFYSTRQAYEDAIRHSPHVLGYRIWGFQFRGGVGTCQHHRKRALVQAAAASVCAACNERLCKDYLRSMAIGSFP